MSTSTNLFTDPTQIDLFGLGDPRADIELAYKMAALDAWQLQCLSDDYVRAYRDARQDDCIKIQRLKRKIKGPVAPPCPPKLRVTRNGRAFPRRVFATGFTAW